MPEAKSIDVKADAHRLIDTLPDNATWDDIMYGIYVRQCIESGIKDVEENRVFDVADVRRKFGNIHSARLLSSDIDNLY